MLFIIPLGISAPQYRRNFSPGNTILRQLISPPFCDDAYSFHLPMAKAMPPCAKVQRKCLGANSARDIHCRRARRHFKLSIISFHMPLHVMPFYAHITSSKNVGQANVTAMLHAIMHDDIRRGEKFLCTLKKRAKAFSRIAMHARLQPAQSGHACFFTHYAGCSAYAAAATLAPSCARHHAQCFIS